MLITEKLVKIYSKDVNFVNIYGTFVPFFYNNDFWASAKLVNRILKFKPDYICIGYDADDNGEFMAYALKNSLIKVFPEEKIFRTPLVEKNYLVFNDFPDISDFLKIKKTERIFIKEQLNKKILPLGIRKTITLKELKNIENKYFEPKHEGTSTFTYIYHKTKEK